MTRLEANEKLLLPQIPPGSFLIRKSVTKVGFALSVKVDDKVIRHYHIKTVWSEVDTSFYITSGLRFPSLARLVQHYRNKAGGLCCVLTCPCCTAERLAPSGHTQNANKDAQTTSSDAKLNSSRGTSQKQAAGQYPQETSCYVKPSSCPRASQKQAEGNRQIHVSLTISPVFSTSTETEKKCGSLRFLY